MNTNQVGLGQQKGLAKYLSSLDVWAIAFGCIVGWGAFVMPGTTFLPLAGPLGAVIALAIGAALMLIIGNNYAYFMKTRPGTGGSYSYTKEAYGRDHAFICSWFLSLSYLSIVFLNATALFVLSRTAFGDFFHFGFHYQIAGFDVYFGEVALSVLALAVFGLIHIFKKPLLQFIQTGFAITLFLGVVILMIAALPHLRFSALCESSGLSDTPIVAAVITIVALAPWAYVGFDVASLETAHFKCPVKRSGKIIAVSILAGALVYIALTVISISYVPDGFSSWQEYIGSLDSLSGTASVPTFYAAEASMGTAGTAIIAVTALSAIVTGIIGAYRASTRVLSNMAVDMIVPKRFLGTTECILFIMIISISVSFLGRNALIWFVDLTSFGAIIGFGYTSASAWKLARKEKNTFVTITGAIGTILSLVFAMAHLLSKVGPVQTMDTQSFLVLSIWCLIGFVFYWRTIRKSELSDFKGVVTSSTVLFCLLLSIIMWFVKSVFDNAGSEQLPSLIISHGVVLIVIVATGVALMLYTQDTLRKRHNRLEHDKIRVDESNKAKSRFLFNISHDIRTPMNAILGYAHLALEENNLPDSIRDYIEIIDLSGKHLLTLMNDILDMSLIESGKLELRNAKADIVKTTGSAFDMFSPQMAEKETRYTMSCEVRHSVAEFDATRLMRVILNLLSNAYKFTPKGGNVSLTLTEQPCEEDAGKGVYILRVKDDGIGMSKEFTESVFRAFERERTATVSRTQGTGLGMSICKSIVDAMNGTIDIVTAPNEGSEFIITVTLPCFEQSALSESTAAKKAARDFTGNRLLLVDDMDINRQIASKLLEKLGFAVECAANGREAVDAVAAHSAGYYDAVLMDIQMPVMDGYAATTAIRSLPGEALRSVPIIAVTANASDEDAQKARDTGMNDHISKPISPVELAETLSRLLPE